MITIKNTENLTGVCISGDYYDLDKLVDALDKNAIWDDTIATIRFFQAEFVKCVKEALTDRAHPRELLNNRTSGGIIFTNIHKLVSFDNEINDRIL